MTLEARADVESEHACGPAARWLPRMLAGAVLAAALVFALGIDPGVPGAAPMRGLLAAAGAALALGIVRRGAEVHVRVGLVGHALCWRRGDRERRLALEDVDQLDWAPAFGRSRHWIPALVLWDRSGAAWRLPVLLDGGDRLLAALLRRSGRNDLRAWANARGLARRMERGSRVLAVGYGAAGSILGLATVLRF